VRYFVPVRVYSKVYGEMLMIGRFRNFCVCIPNDRNHRYYTGSPLQMWNATQHRTKPDFVGDRMFIIFKGNLTAPFADGPDYFH
jgi:hypothetical protein